MELRFNTTSPFTRWVVKSALLEEPFVLIDVGVQGGESARWHLLGDYLIVNGFDAIKEVIEELTDQNRGNPNRHYHWLAVGAADEEQRFYFNSADPFSSSLYLPGEDRFALLEQRRDALRTVSVRRLDTLFANGVIPRADFIKCDVEGYEQQVFVGGRQLLKSALGVECESNFGISPFYRNSHFGTIQNILLEANLLAIDLNFNRVPRASFVRAVCRKGGDPAAMKDLGKNAKTTHLLVVAQRKMYDHEFCIPFQEQYENMIPDEARARYTMIVDGEILDGKRVKYLTKDEMLAKEYQTEIMHLNNWVAAYKGQIDALKHELAVTKHHFDQLRYGPPPEPFSAQIAALAEEVAELRAAAVDNTKARDLAVEVCRRVRRRLVRSAHLG